MSSGRSFFFFFNLRHFFYWEKKLSPPKNETMDSSVVTSTISSPSSNSNKRILLQIFGARDLQVKSKKHKSSNPYAIIKLANDKDKLETTHKVCQISRTNEKKKNLRKKTSFKLSLSFYL